MFRCKKAEIATQLSAGLVALAMLPGGVAHADQAQQSQAQSGGVLEEVVVVAQKRTQNLQSVPIAVTALTSSTLVKYGVGSNPLDLTLVTPGLQATQVVSGFSARIRGIGTTDNTPGNEGAVSMYVDGVYIPGTAGGLLSLSNIERIEVLKGPQGTLFGRNTTGGLINIITKTPSHDTGGNLSFSYANYDDKVVKGYATTGLGEDVAVDFAGRVEDQGKGWGKNIYNGADAFKINNRAFRSKMLITPGTDTTITLAGDYYKYNNQMPAWRKRISTDYYDYNQDFIPRQYGKTWGASLRLEHDFGVAKLVTISAYRDLEQTFKMDVDLTPQPVQQAVFPAIGKSYSQEIRLLSPDSSELQWITGLYYFHNQVSMHPITQTGTILQNAFAFNPILNKYEAYNKQNTTSYAAFAQATYPIFDDTNLTLGIRYTHDAQDYVGYSRRYPVAGGVLVSPSIRDELKTDKSTYRVVLDHHFTSDVMAYISYNTGYKSGFYNIAGFPADSAGPEFLKAYELGVKSEMFDSRLRVNAAAYYYKYTDIQSLYLLQGAAVALNAGSAQIKGLEMQINAVPLDNWNVNLGFNWMPHAKYNKFSPCPGPVNPPVASPFSPPTYDCSGTRMVNTPRWDVTLGTDYTIPSAIGDFNFSVAYEYVSSYPWDANFHPVKYWLPPNPSTVYYSTSVFKESAHNFVNVRATWTSPGDAFNVAVWARNLTDVKHLVYGNQSSGSGKIGAPGAPRTYGVTLGYKF